MCSITTYVFAHEVSLVPTVGKVGAAALVVFDHMPSIKRVSRIL